MSSWEIRHGPCGTLPPAEIKPRSPRYLFFILPFQRRRENYRPLITQGEERATSIFVISSTTIKHFRKRAWKPEIVSQGAFRPAPSLITHKRNKNEDLSLPLCFISKSICAVRSCLGSGSEAVGNGNILLMCERTWGKSLCHFQAGCIQDIDRF